MPGFPFSVELREGDGREVVIGTVASPVLAWACYYAALRAYPDDVVLLREFGSTLAQSRRPAVAATAPPDRSPRSSDSGTK